MISLIGSCRNTDKGQVHKDVTVLINDGEKTWDMMTVCAWLVLIIMKCMCCVRDGTMPLTSFNTST